MAVPLDGIRFHPYYSVHDVQGIAVFLFFFCAVIFFAPEMSGFFLEYANFEEAKRPQDTRAHSPPSGISPPFTLYCARCPTSFGVLFSSQFQW